MVVTFKQDCNPKDLDADLHRDNKMVLVYLDYFSGNTVQIINPNSIVNGDETAFEITIKNYDSLVIMSIS